MHEESFSVILHSINYPIAPEDKETWDGLSADSKYLLDRLYNKFMSDLECSRDPYLIEDQLRGSIFALCIPEGYVLITCNAHGKNRTISINGFLVRMDEGLRTVWSLARWQILFLCASGWEKSGTVKMTTSEIRSLALSCKFKDDYNRLLIDIGKQLLSSPAPFSFMLSNYPEKIIPLAFDSQNIYKISNLSENANDKGIIRIAQDDCNYFLELNRSVPGLGSLHIINMSRKDYINIKLAEAPDPTEQKKRKAALKELFNKYPDGNVWCFKNSCQSLTFTLICTPKLNNLLTNNTVLYEYLESEIRKFQEQADDYYRSVARRKEIERIRQEKAVKKPKDVPPASPAKEDQKTAPPHKQQSKSTPKQEKEQKEGFFKGLFHKG